MGTSQSSQSQSRSDKKGPFPCSDITPTVPESLKAATIVASTSSQFKDIGKRRYLSALIRGKIGLQGSNPQSIDVSRRTGLAGRVSSFTTLGRVLISLDAPLAVERHHKQLE